MQLSRALGAGAYFLVGRAAWDALVKVGPSQLKPSVVRTAGGAIDSNEQTPQAATPWEFYAGGVLIGLAFGELAAHAVASVPASSPTPGWVSVLCALVATIVAATAAGSAMRLAWLLIASGLARTGSSIGTQRRR